MFIITNLQKPKYENMKTKYPWTDPQIFICIFICIYIHINLYMYIYKSIIYIYLYICIYNGILLSHKEEWNNDIFSNRNGSKWNKPDQERQIWYHMYVFGFDWWPHAMYISYLSPSWAQASYPRHHMTCLWSDELSDTFSFSVFLCWFLPQMVFLNPLVWNSVYNRLVRAIFSNFIFKMLAERGFIFWQVWESLDWLMGLLMFFQTQDAILHLQIFLKLW